ncbi:MFS transporter [Candidatus Pelagibacter sp.]|nr:MFS transporter [Candidatus Pelagibacter sp.]
MDRDILPFKKGILVFFVFACAYFISCLLRAITATLSPSLTAEFNLLAGDLGLLAGGYFLGFATMQLPLGYLLDKHGPKKIVSSFLLIAIVGTASFALAKSFTGLLVSRIFIGVGVSACLMGPLTGYRIWFADHYQQRLNSWMLMIASTGFVFSTLPVQILLPIFGWRWIFGGISILVFVCILLILFFIPKWKQKSKGENVKNIGTLSDVWKNKFFRSTIPLGLFNYGGMIAVQTLWAGPWMVRVSGYNPLESATGLFGINIVMLTAFFIWGYFLPKIIKGELTSFKLMKFGLPVSYLVLLIIIILGSKAGAILLTLYILTSIFLTLAQPAVALSFPTYLAGKAFTSFNLLIFIGTFIMQWGIGLVIDLAQKFGNSEVVSFQISFFVYFLICIFCYLYFVLKNRNE